MLFNTPEFAIFFAVILTLYWSMYRWRHIQNIILLGGSMYFYSRLHFSFPFFLAAIITASYLFACLMARNEDHKKRRMLLVCGICTVSTGLIYARYGVLLSNLPVQWQTHLAQILTPIGISFYTFSAIGYMTDVYRRKINAEKNILTYATYISFFPHLLSGPIPSAQTILPQFNKKSMVPLREWDESIGEIIWGLFKKMVVADNIAIAVSYCFAEYRDLNGSTLIIGAALFGMQLYADFSGYSSIARGTAGLLGIRLIQNFQLPFSSKSITEYWRRWHISLTNWFYEYIYNPIVTTYRDGGKWTIAAGLMVTFLISGLWHGTGWQFVIWGALHGIIMVYEALTRKQRKKIHKKAPPLFYSFTCSVLVWAFLCFTWVFFRSANIQDAMGMLNRIFTRSLIKAPVPYIFRYTIWCLPMLIIEWLQRKGAYTMDIGQWLLPEKISGGRISAQNAAHINHAIQTVVYIMICVAIYLFCKKQNAIEYYYFRF